MPPDLQEEAYACLEEGAGARARGRSASYHDLAADLQEFNGDGGFEGGAAVTCDLGWGGSLPELENEAKAGEHGDGQSCDLEER